MKKLQNGTNGRAVEAVRDTSAMRRTISLPAYQMRELELLTQEEHRAGLSNTISYLVETHPLMIERRQR